MTDHLPPIDQLFENNRAWAERRVAETPDFFNRLSAQQSPEFLWIGCSDSRVPANEIVDLMPGELFVHRNVANLVVHTDLNCLSVVQYAIDVLKVKHVMVCGHYGCGGIRGALAGSSLGLIDNWLRHVIDIAELYQDILSPIDDFDQRVNCLCELNVIEQVRHLCQTTIVREAWARRQPLAIHGWVYGLHDGRLRDLGVSTSDAAAIDSVHQNAVRGLRERGVRP